MASSIGSTSSVRNLGVVMDTELSMKKHITKVTSVCYFHLRRLKTVRRILDEKTIASLVTVFIISRLDYCNFLLAGLPKKSTIMPIQRYNMPLHGKSALLVRVIT